MAKMDKDTINNIVRTAVKEAVDHIESDIVPARTRRRSISTGKVTLALKRGARVLYRLRCATRFGQPSLR